MLGLVVSAADARAAGPFASDIARIADQIEAHYFDVTRARTIAAEIRDAAHQGEFDGAVDPRSLAAQLTSRLQPHDHHFVVTWTADANTQGRSSAPPPAAPADIDRRGAYGFRRVEMLPGAVAYIDLRWLADFDFADIHAPARAAADAALTLARGADAVILDLRDNGGGSPAMVGYLVSAFTAPDADIYNVFHSREGTESERPKTPYPAPRLDVPLYVLISGRTGSAAEATAYTLQAAKRATIVGEPSAGAANPGDLFAVGDGFAVFVSTGTPINAVTGANWETSGVIPDVSIASVDALARAQVLALEQIVARPSASVDARWTLEALRAEPVDITSLAGYAGRYGEVVVTSADDGLVLQRGRRPGWKLTRISGDVFAARDEPTRRVVFERTTSGEIAGVEVILSTGQSAWFYR
jgi:hypothetical protein